LRHDENAICKQVIRPAGDSSEVQQRPLTATALHVHQQPPLAGTAANVPALPLVRDEEANLSQRARDMPGMTLGPIPEAASSQQVRAGGTGEAAMVRKAVGPEWREPGFRNHVGVLFLSFEPDPL
jgi:hypothetical protein